MARRLTALGAVLVAALLAAPPLGATAQAQETGSDPEPVAAPRIVVLAGPETDAEPVPAPQVTPSSSPGFEASHAATTITVNYLTSFPAEAQAVFEEAASIWSELIASSVPIQIDASWTNLGPGVLGGAGATALFSSGGRIFQAALLNALTGVDHCTPSSLCFGSSAEIDADFSSTANWYFGLDGNVPFGKYDLLTVVLHEIGHGLGWSGGMTVSGADGDWYLSQPFIYDDSVVNGTGTSILSYAHPSTALKAQLTGNNLFLDGTFAKRGAGGIRPKIYAPSTWSGGSSYSHLDEVTYPAGSPHALMTPIVGSGEANHNPGGVSLGLLRDIGWGAHVVPAAPVVSATPSGSTANVSWSVADDGGSGITSYRVDMSPGGISKTVPAPATSTQFPSLPNGSYTFTVTATNGIGPSPSSISAPVAISSGVAPPPNDLLANATVLSGSTVDTTGTSLGALNETGEPLHAGGSRSVWWRWTAPVSGPATITTQGSSFDSTLAAYTGNSIGSLTLVAADDNGGAGFDGVSFTANAGTTYRIAVAGADAAVGSIGLHLASVSPDTPPTVSITDPAGGSSVKGVVDLVASAGDDNGVTQVEFLVDGNSVGVDSNGGDGWSLRWNSAAVGDGQAHTLTAIATDTAAQTTTSATVNVTILSNAVADFDGDGATDIAVFRPSSRQWFITGQPPVTKGAPGDIPVAMSFAVRDYYY